MPDPAIRFLDAGEAALVVEFGDTVDRAISDRVLGLDAALGALVLDGIVECVPTYRSLMIHYDPLVLERAALVRAVEGALAANRAGTAPEGRNWLLPCCYDGAHGEDLVELAALLGLTPDEVVRIHGAASYRVYMCGFAPGYTYLGDVPSALAVSRRPVPRPPHPAGAVLLGGGLGAVASCAMPTGWYVIGATPERLFAPERDRPFLFQAGDSLRFAAVDTAEFATLAARVQAGERVAREVA
jgi:KipI family sensor histidine kinase inhibitor